MNPVEVLDLRECPRSGLYYGGAAGRKIGILIEGVPWIAKFPRTTKDLEGRRLPSYTSSPVSEYIGSEIYRVLGIDTHEVKLGYREGKIVCACRDFTYPDKRLVEFRELRNTVSDDSPGYHEVPSNGQGVFLNDVLVAIETLPELRETPGVKERFWDMFVVDALIKNPDRNNGNWGLLRSPDGSFELAPVYDNGSSLFNKRSASLAEERLADERLVEQDAFGTNVSVYRLEDPERPEGRAIHPFEYMRQDQNPDLVAAVQRIAARMDLHAINEIINAVPNIAYGCVLLTDGQKQSHKELVRRRFEEGLAPLAELRSK